MVTAGRVLGLQTRP